MQVDDERTTKRRSGSFSFPFLQGNVPKDQQPVVELKNLRQQPFFNWADDKGYKNKLIGLYQAISLFASLPIAYTTYYNIPDELPNLLLAANLGTLAAMLPFVLRLRVGWGFVSKRVHVGSRTCIRACQ